MVTVCEKRSQALRIVVAEVGAESEPPLSRRRRADNGAWLHRLRRPLALTMGDACGIGPEIIAAWFRSADAGGCVRRRRRRGDAPRGGARPAACCRWRGSTRPPTRRRCRPTASPVLQADGLRARPRRRAARPRSTRAPARPRRAASSRRSPWSLRGEAAALVTAPIHKEAFAAAGIAYPGHTEMLQALAAGRAARCRRCA